MYDEDLDLEIEEQDEEPYCSDCGYPIIYCKCDDEHDNKDDDKEDNADNNG